MAVDPSKLKSSSRRSLGVPPTDGSPGIDVDLKIEDSQPTTVKSLDPRLAKTDSSPEAATHTHDSRGSGEISQSFRRKESSAPASERTSPAEQGRGERPRSQGRQRVPPPQSEARIPFTTRVTASTKERLEDACHFLRVKHQEFINQAIDLHLEKHGF